MRRNKDKKDVVDITQTHPELAKQWSPNNAKKPSEVSAGSKFRAEWICESGHVFSAAIANRAKRNSGCPYCSGRLPVAGVNDLATTHPELAKQWSSNNTKKPSEVSAGSRVSVEWICELGHSWKARVESRAQGNTGCAVCKNRVIIDGFNDLETNYPDIAKEWSERNEKSPNEFAPMSSFLAEWVCSQCSYLYKAKISDRTYRKTGCPVCAGQKVVAGLNDLASTHPELAKQWSPNNAKKPSEVSAGSKFRAEWICKRSHKWMSTVQARKKGDSCPSCSGQKVSVGFNDLATTHPELAKQWSPNNTKKPSEVSYATNTIIEWVCELGHVWNAYIANRSIHKHGCPICAGRSVFVGFNDLATTHPELAKQWSSNNTKKPSEVTYGTQLKVEWVCLKDEAHKWVMAVNKQTGGSFGRCPYCCDQSSKAEQEINDYVQNLGFKTLKDRKVLAGKELDIYIPEKQVAIEFNGLYWHSEEKGKDKHYHYNKYRMCKDSNIKLLQIWEDDYRDKKDLVKEVIAYKLNLSSDRIFARNTNFVKVSAAEGSDFLDSHHLQGAYKNAKHYGLKDKNTDELLAVMSTRFDKKRKELEIKRFAIKGSVPGGFSKLLKNICSEHKAEYTAKGEYNGALKLVSYSHNDHSWGEVYAKNGFDKIHEGTPGYFYVKNSKREFRLNYSPKRFKERDDLVYKDGLSEKELADLNGLVRIWDAGSARWEKSL